MSDSIYNIPVKTIDLEETTRRLFVDAAAVFGTDSVSVAGAQGPSPVVRITANGRTVQLPANKNLLVFEGRVHALEGVVVYVPPTGRAYIPQQAVAMVRSLTGLQ